MLHFQYLQIIQANNYCFSMLNTALDLDFVLKEGKKKLSRSLFLRSDKEKARTKQVHQPMNFTKFFLFSFCAEKHA